MTRALAALAFALALIASPADAAQCAPASMMIPALQNSGERVIWKAIAGAHLALLFQHRKNQKWTFLAISPEKLACVIAHGGDAELGAGREARVNKERRGEP